MNQIDYDSEVEDLPDMNMQDIKINPEYYIHSALLKAQQALLEPNLNEGIVRYQIFIQMIESMCKAANLLDDTYKTELDEYMATPDYKLSSRKEAKIATKKLELLLGQIFAYKTHKGPIKL